MVWPSKLLANLARTTSGSLAPPTQLNLANQGPSTQMEDWIWSTTLRSYISVIFDLFCGGLWPSLFFASCCTQISVSFSKSKGQVISHVTRHVLSHVMSHGTSHVMGQVINHMMADSCIMCTLVVTQQLTEHQALMTHCQGCQCYLWIPLLFC
jgi:hypothetical protein